MYSDAECGRVCAYSPLPRDATFRVPAWRSGVFGIVPYYT